MKTNFEVIIEKKILDWYLSKQVLHPCWKMLKWLTVKTQKSLNLVNFDNYKNPTAYTTEIYRKEDLLIKRHFKELLLHLSLKNALCTLFKVFFNLYYVTKKCSFSQTCSLLRSKLENLWDKFKIYFFTFSCFSLKVVIRVYL